jgi:hypothetical protein
VARCGLRFEQIRVAKLVVKEVALGGSIRSARRGAVKGRQDFARPGFPFEEEAEISGVHGTRTACVSPSPDSVPPWIPTRRNCLRFLECSGAERRECQHCQRGPAFCELHSSDPSSKYSSGKYLRRLSTLSADAGIYRMPGVVFFPDCANVIGILAGPLDRLNRWRWNWDRMALDRARLF